MGGMKYEDLDLLLSRAENGFTARVVHSPAGDGQCTEFGPLFSDLEVENFELRIARGKTRTRRVEAGPVADAKRFGAVLFDSVFAGDTRECLRRSQDYARERQAMLRIRLRLADCPELANLPWEFLYDAREDSFLALSVATPLVRYSQLPDPPRAVTGSLPLRVLVIRSEPTDLPELQLEDEWAQVNAAVRGLSQSGAVTFTPLAKPTLGELRLALMQGRFHVLHFMGHGSFTEETGGVLYFTGADGRAVAVTAADLGVILRDHTSMRMAVLNACEGARTDPGDPFAGVAETLVRRGVPAVVAMQFEFTDQAAVEFAPALYGALAAGLPVDAAVTEARKAVYTVSPVEWATPVLHLRAQDATLFSLSAPTASSTVPPGQLPPRHDRESREPHGGQGTAPRREQSGSAPPKSPPPILPPGMAAISIRRSTEWLGRARGYSVIINGKLAGKVRSGQREIYPLPPGTYRVMIKMDWYSSPEYSVTVAPGECATFVCSHTEAMKSMTNPSSYYELVRE